MISFAYVPSHRCAGTDAGMRSMGIFGRKAGNREEAAGTADVFTAPERERIEALWRLTALPRAEFEATYGAMLGGFWRYAASAGGEAWAALRRETLACAVAALRARQARVLPRFAAEDAARLAEVMSFALAACVVAERFAAVAGRTTAPGWRPLTEDVPETAAPTGAAPRRPFGALLLARLAGEAGLGWLGQEPAALRALAAYFGDGPSELRAIAEEAERRIGLPLDRGPPVSAPDAPPAEETTADRTHAPQPQAATDAPEPAPERASPPAIGGEGAGWEWINWVRAGLRDGSVPVNAGGAWLHNIAGEAYAVAPACFEAFAAGRDLATATIRNRVVRLGRHRSRASRSGAANLFRAVLADGSRVEGMVFPGELFWDDIGVAWGARRTYGYACAP